MLLIIYRLSFYLDTSTTVAAMTLVGRSLLRFFIKILLLLSVLTGREATALPRKNVYFDIKLDASFSPQQRATLLAVHVDWEPWK